MALLVLSPRLHPQCQMLLVVLSVQWVLSALLRLCRRDLPVILAHPMVL